MPRSKGSRQSGGDAPISGGGGSGADDAVSAFTVIAKAPSEVTRIARLLESWPDCPDKKKALSMLSSLERKLPTSVAVLAASNLRRAGETSDSREKRTKAG